MRHIALYLLFIFLAVIQTAAQDTIDIVEKNIKVSALSRETEYYGFAAGDKVIFSLSVENNKELKDVTIAEYPANIKFADHSTSKLFNKVFNIPRQGIYSFEYYNSNISGRIVNIKLQRIPRSEATRFFNTNVKWVTKTDTTYFTREKQVLVSSDTTYEDPLDAIIQVHSQTNASSSNASLIDFILPANTIRLAYWIGVGQEAQNSYRELKSQMTGLIGKLAGTISPLAGLFIKPFVTAHLSVGENVRYYFMSSYEDALKFKSRQPFMQFKNADVVADAGVIPVQRSAAKRYYIGLVNDNLIQGIDVTVKISAQIVQNRYETIVEKAASYTNKLVPINEE